MDSRPDQKPLWFYCGRWSVPVVIIMLLLWWVTGPCRSSNSHRNNRETQTTPNVTQTAAVTPSLPGPRTAKPGLKKAKPVLEPALPPVSEPALLPVYKPILSPVPEPTRSPIPEAALLPEMHGQASVPAAPTSVSRARERALAFSSNRADGRFFHLYVMNENGGNIRQLTYSQCFDRDPHFSHSGEAIAFCSNRGGEDYQIYILDMQTQNIRQVTTGHGAKVNPLWLPDDQKLVYTMTKDNVMQLNLINIDGSGQRRLTDASSTIYANDISPDGCWICCFKTVAGKRNMVVLYDFTNGQVQPLFVNDDVTNFCDPFFDPSTRRLFYTADHIDHKVRTLYVYDFDWKTSTRVMTDNVDRDDPAISSDRALIAYAALWNNAWNIYVMNADGTEIRNLTVSLADNQSPTWR